MSDIPTLSDAELVRRTLDGRQDAFKELVGRYQGHVYGLAYSLTGDWADAQDAAQEAFIRAYTNLDQLRQPERFAAWLRRVAFGVSMDWLRRLRPKLFQQLDGRVDLERLEIPDFRPGPPEAAVRRELAEAVLAAVASLPPHYRLPLTMFHLDGLSYKKVADFLDIPLGTAKGLISRAQAKLKAILAPAATKEMIPMVQEVFNEHKLPEEFASKVIQKVPSLGWGRGKECTFAGALEAALAATAHPCKYTDIMGFTALAFRTRWYKGGKGWCPSAAVGEMEEEIAAASRATGWPLKIELHFDEKERPQATANIVESINAGKPVLSYNATEDMAVVYGYGQRGAKLLLRDYHKGEQALEMEAGKIGWLWLLLGDHKELVSADRAVLEGLKMAVQNWRRKVGKEGPGEYWYGPAAYEAWIDLLRRGDELGPEDRPGVCHCNWWCHLALLDARRAAVAFLCDHAPQWEQGPARQALQGATDFYRHVLETANSPEFTGGDCFLHPRTDKGLERWTPQVRQRGMKFLRQAMEIDEAAAAQIDKALAAMA